MEENNQENAGEGVGGEKKQKIMDWLKIAAIAGMVGMRYRKTIVHKLMWAIFKRSVPYIIAALIILVALVAGLTYLFVRLFS